MHSFDMSIQMFLLRVRVATYFALIVLAIAMLRGHVTA